ncbi:hypothetical protein BgiMline_028217 [Biomphalaria glabrata]|nr:hypothetical protein BgiMline_014031 [Biomphalaria glabrata]
MHCIGFKSAINKNNWPATLDFLQVTKAYLLSLKTYDGHTLHLTKRHMSVTGFLVNIEKEQEVGTATQMSSSFRLLEKNFLLDVELFLGRVEVFLFLEITELVSAPVGNANLMSDGSPFMGGKESNESNSMFCLQRSFEINQQLRLRTSQIHVEQHVLSTASLHQL